MSNIVSKVLSGLFKDYTKEEQPEGTYSFALNAVMDNTFKSNLSNEEGNEVFTHLPTGYKVIGDCYIDNNELILFLVNEVKNLSEIGVVRSSKKYETIVNSNLGFRTTHQIDCTYRLRRGCEKTIYFTDGLNPPRIVNLGKLKDFKESYYNAPIDFDDPYKYWDADKFSLFRKYNSIPNISNNIKIEENGQLVSGSYVLGIQYLDESKNPTEVIVTTEPIVIYNSKYSDIYSDIKGSTATVDAFHEFKSTGKSIGLNIDNLDSDFPFYRLCVLEYTSGNGQLTSVKYTSTIPYTVRYFEYSGSNYEVEGSLEEVQQFGFNIATAKHIEQLENRLILSNTTDKKVDYCSLQKYASRITSKATTKTISLGSIELKDDPKRCTLFNENIGYQPGEIYAFGIMYLFSDNSLSPVYHIPGKNSTHNSNMGIDNTCNSTFYTANSDLSAEEYWGVDSQGDTLANQKVRHHRFPFRSDLNIGISQKHNLDGTPIDLTDPSSIKDPSRINTELYINISGEIDAGYAYDTFTVTVNYVENTIAKSKDVIINVDDYLNIYENNQQNVFITSSNSPLEFVDVIETDELDQIVTTNAIYQEDYIYQESSSTSGSSTSEIIGIEFNNIEIPNISGEEVVGYYIVRLERTEANKSIVDTALMIPTIENTVDGTKFVSHSMLSPMKHLYEVGSSGNDLRSSASKIIDSSGDNEIPINKYNNLPEDEKISLRRDIFALVSPQHKFKNKEYSNVDTIHIEGIYKKPPRQGGLYYKKVFKKDVQEGTSYDANVHGKKGADTDGWDLAIATRYSKLFYEKDYYTKILSSNSGIKDIFYLNGLDSRKSEDFTGELQTIYNLSADNKIGIVVLDRSIDYLKEEALVHNPYNNTEEILELGDSGYFYVALKKNISNPYSNFRTDRYYKEHSEPIMFNNGQKSRVEIFSGDSFTSSMEYFSSFHYKSKVLNRDTKNPTLNYVAAGVAVVGAVVAAYFGQVQISAAAAVFAANQIKSGVTKSQMAKFYSTLYSQGLDKALRDVFTYCMFYRNFSDENQADDTIGWFFEALDQVTFDSQINLGWRYGYTIGLNDFYRSDGEYNSGDFSQYCLDKVTVPSERNDGVTYLGEALAETYDSNPDYYISNIAKNYYHLPFEYSCKGGCNEEFKNRIYYSQQSFQEELSDNFRTVLPNNYKDIESSSGQISNLFRIQNNLFAHTEDALWQILPSIQEKIIGDIVTYLGTGEFLSLPERKIVDSENGVSAGSRHKWGTLKTPNGVFFISEHQGTIYKFTGNALEPISSKGLFNWFKNNIKIQYNQDYFNINSKEYDYDDNPSNDIGTGFISVYDSKNERILITKKDQIDSGLDYTICTKNGNTIKFEDFEEKISNKESLGWYYEGIEDCRMKFSRTSSVTRQVEIAQNIPNNADIVVHMDMTGSFNDENRLQIRQAIFAWKESYGSLNPDWTGELYFCEYSISDPDVIGSEMYLSTLRYIDNMDYIYLYDTPTTSTQITDPSKISKDIVVVSFVNEAHAASYNDGYHSNIVTPQIDPPGNRFSVDLYDFITRYESRVSFGGSFKGLMYPIIYSGDASSEYIMEYTQSFLQHIIAAFRGINFTQSFIDSLIENPFCDRWDEIIASLSANAGINPYPSDDLYKYNWDYIATRGWDGTGDIISVVDFQNDMQNFVSGSTDIEIENREFPITEYSYVDGVVDNNLQFVNNGWTMSYSLFNESWISYHSYLPNYYLSSGVNFFSIINSQDIMWKHNITGKYQNYYDKKEKFILEYVAKSNNLETKIFECIKFATHASRYNSTTKEFNVENTITFNRFIGYTYNQTTGERDFVPKVNSSNYLLDQTFKSSGVRLDSNQKEWAINELRNYLVDNNLTMFDSNINSLQSDYFIDKILNNSNINFNKPWFEVEPLKGKYLVIRFIFDTFDDVNLTFTSSLSTDSLSRQ